MSLHDKLEIAHKALDQDKIDTSKLLSIDLKHLQMDNNTLYGYHYRITKKIQTSIKNINQLVQIISIQKSGALFYSNKVNIFDKL